MSWEVLVARKILLQGMGAISTSGKHVSYNSQFVDEVIPICFLTKFDNDAESIIIQTIAVTR